MCSMCGVLDLSRGFAVLMVMVMAAWCGVVAALSVSSVQHDL